MGGWLRDLVLAAALAATSCAGTSVKTDFDATADFEQLRTFSWLEPPERLDADPFADNTLLRKRIREAAELELVAKGFGRVPVENADFLVTFHVTLEDKLRVESVAASCGPIGPVRVYNGFYRDPWGGFECAPSFRADTWRQGTLVLDLLDRDAGGLIWRGWVSGVVATQDSDRQRVAVGVAEILESFPPSAPH